MSTQGAIAAGIGPVVDAVDGGVFLEAVDAGFFQLLDAGLDGMGPEQFGHCRDDRLTVQRRSRWSHGRFRTFWRGGGRQSRLVGQGSANEVAAVDDKDVAVDVVRGPAGQGSTVSSHQVGDLTPAALQGCARQCADPERQDPRTLLSVIIVCDIPRDGIDLDVVAHGSSQWSQVKLHDLQLLSPAGSGRR